MGWVYGIQSGAFIKVGVASHLGGRLNMFRLYNPHPIKVVLRRQIEEPFWIEKRMHQLLAPYGLGREWFDCSVDLVRAAYEQAEKDLIARRYSDAKVLSEMRERADKRAVDKAAKTGTERGIDNAA